MSADPTIRLDQLDARVRSVWSRTQRLHLVAGLLAMLRWAVPLFLLGVLIDWLTDLPAAARGVMLVALVSVVLYRAWRCGWRHLRPFNAVHAALQLESHHGQLSSLLVSAIQLRSSATTTTGSASLRDHTYRLAEAAAAELRPQEAVPYQPLYRPSGIAAMCFATIMLFALVNSSFLAAGVMRLFSPWLAIEYPTQTQITLDQSELVIQEGDKAAISAQLQGVLPKHATIFVRTGGGRARAIDLDVNNASCTYTLASASRDFDYRIKAGDDRTDWHTVRVVPAPRIERVRVQQVFPEYLGKENQTIEALTLTVPEGTKVNWQLTLDRPIKSATFIRDGESPVPLSVEEDGRTLTLSQQVSDSRGYTFEWTDREHGFSFTSPRYYLQVASDQAPRVELSSPASNLAAMLGRPLNLATRVQDDHGIGSASVIYRVNQREDVKAGIHDELRDAQGEQSITWDYREALSDLVVGDTVSFAIEVSDRYPGPQGPHVVRSETRRVTFLSREDYLAQIQKQKDRLLSRVQTLYRQQRWAHESVQALLPKDAGYLQACQLEAIRQEMVREELRDIALQMKLLLDDLAANNVVDAVEGESLEMVRLALQDIAESHIARSATLLRGQSGKAGDDPSPAADAVNAAARELARLVMLRGIEAAQEVYAREARMLAQVQAALRWSAVNASADAGAKLADRQGTLAQWTDRLITDLQEGMRYDKRPLAVLRLLRSVKDLRDAQTSGAMREAGDLIRGGKVDQAVAMQADIVRTLLNAEFSVRLSGAYSTLLKTRDQVAFIRRAQLNLREQMSAMSADAFESRRGSIQNVQADLRRQMVTLLLPSIPAPRAELFDETPAQPPAVDELLARVDRAMSAGLSALESGDKPAAQAQQLQAEQALAELLGIVDRWSTQMGLETQGLGTVVAATSERLSRLEAFEARVIGILEKTDIAAAEKQKVDALAETQLILADELSGFMHELSKFTEQDPDPDLPPLLSRLTRAERAMRSAVQSLGSNDADQAIGYQEQAADVLAEAYALVEAQNARLSMLQDMLMFQRSVGFANGYMADLVAEQRDLLELTESSQSEDVKRILPKFGNIRDCMVDIAPLLDLVAARLDVGTPLAFAKADFEDAIVSLQSGDKLDAIDAQDVAAESLGKVQVLIAQMQTQTGYVAEIVAYLHGAVADAGVLQVQQQELLHKAESARTDDLPKLIEEQQALLTRAEVLGRSLVSATGRPEFAQPAQCMQDAIVKLKANDLASAIQQMQLAEAALAENAESALAVITVLHGLPAIEISAQSEPELVRLIDVLALASSHKSLFRQTQVADASAMDGLAKQQTQYAASCKQVASAISAQALLDAARDQLTQAVSAFASQDREAIRNAQRAGDEKLRHFIVQQALILDTSVPPPAASDSSPTDDGPGSDSASEFAAGFISDFVSGEVPQDKRTQWNVLADRNRAALNQNFARELPLEYRALLKNYYERVAE